MSNAAPADPAPTRLLWWPWVSRLYLLACASALIALLATQHGALARLEPEVPWLLLVSACAVALTHAFAILFTKGLMACLTVPLSDASAADLHLRFMPARYLPGGIWHTVGRVEWLRRSGVSMRRSTVLPLVESVSALAAATVLSLLLLSLPLTLSSWLLGSLLWMATCALASWHMGPRLQAAGALSALLGFWACQQLAFGLFLMALGSSAPATSTGWWLLAWAIGHLAIFAPQGVGVSELAFARLAGGGLDAALVVTAFRVVQASGDLLAWLAWQALRKVLRA